jgi:AraC-like DNA-binding protein
VSPGERARRFFEGEQPAPAPFAEHVLAYSSLDVALPDEQHALHTIWPDGCVALVVLASARVPLAATIVGPRLRALRIPVRHGTSIRSLRLWPDTAAQVLGVDPVAIRDLTRPAAELLGVGALSLARSVAAAAPGADLDAVWERWLAPRVTPGSLPDPEVRLVVRLLIESDGTHDLGTAARSAGVSARALERRFRAVVGLSPRQFARVRRVRAAIAEIAAGQRSMSRLAARLGHPDQPSFVREFRSLAGLTPDTLVAQLDQLEHSDPRARISAS